MLVSSRLVLREVEESDELIARYYVPMVLLEKRRRESSCEEIS